MVQHFKSCYQYQSGLRRATTYKPGDEIVKFRRQGTQCVFCDSGVCNGMMEWHWHNNPDCDRYQQLFGGATMAAPPGERHG